MYSCVCTPKRDAEGKRGRERGGEEREGWEGKRGREGGREGGREREH